ncbi:FAD/NAD(P)-binding protein [Leucobacter sp. gxy201]|uniref:FAD/NAD(P)-binding protein n=1 Tax=Leucobacter sp. gxy201 TaxID=2957200 RepID=UPI003DA0B932
MTSPSIAIIGAGVRGTAALGRIAARLNGGDPVRDPLAFDVHVIDEFPAGSGRIWRAGQPRSLVMNTVPAQSTVFGDATLGFEHDSPGPSFAEWCTRVADGGIAADSAEEREAAAATRPWSFPSRALYGAYLRWAYAGFAASLPAGARLIEHRARATRVARTADGRFAVSLGADRITVDAVLLALGWLPRHAGDGHDVPPANPIDQRIERLLPGETVAVRGVGMGFTDLLGLVTEERGGRYAPRPGASRAGELDYAPSGREPVLIAGSRTALPFLAKPDFGAVPPAADLASLSAAMPRLRAARPLDFGRDVLPLIERDAAAVYHRALAELHAEAYREAPSALLDEFDGFDGAAGASADVDRWRDLERDLVPDPALRFDPWRPGAPLEGATLAEIDAEIADRLDRDAAEAALGMRSAWKRGLHVFQAARSAIIPLTDFGGVTRESVAGLDRFLWVAGLIGSGPPLFRVEQLLAAHRAGVVRFSGPGARIEHVDGPSGTRRRVVALDGSATPIDRVFDARLDLPDPARHDSPLLAALIDDGDARLWTGAQTGAGAHRPPTLEITPADSALIGADGAPVAGLHSVGPLHEELRRFTIIAPIPGVGSTVLREIDAAVAAMLDRALANHPDPATDRDEPAHAH